MKSNKNLIYPNSNFKIIWDAIMCAILLINLFFIPIKIVFVNNTDPIHRLVLN